MRSRFPLVSPPLSWLLPAASPVSSSRRNAVLLPTMLCAAMLSVIALPASTFAQAANSDSARGRVAPSVGEDPLRGDPRAFGALSIQARQMQDTFEKNRRGGLRFYNGGATAGCDVEIGTLCYWNNNGDVPPPAERNDAKVERLQLLDMLAKAQAAEPKDDWVNGMRVRYAIEADDNAMAMAAARACRGEPWWCAALEGLALHVDNRHELAQAAFDKALAAMPAAQQCEWLDLTPWLDTTSHGAYRAKGCNERKAMNALVFRYAQPLWMLPVNDVRNELLARWTISRVHSLGRVPYDVGFSDAITMMQVRYGWPTAWSMQNGGVADPRPPSVIGHEPTPSYDFMPSPKALESPLDVSVDDWDPMRKKARMRYHTRYASGYGMLPHQIARFRRGDSTVLAGAYRLMRELQMGAAPYRAGFVIDHAPGSNPSPIVVVRDSARANGAVIAPLGNRKAVASLEVLAPQAKRAARARLAVEPLESTKQLSDFLLLQRVDPNTITTLDAAANNAFGALHIPRRATIGLYWEIYRNVTPQSPVQVSIRATRIESSFMQRLTSAIGLSKSITPVAIRYTDNGRTGGEFGRALSVVMPDSPGDYELSLIVTGAGVSDTTSRMIRILADSR